MDPTEILTAEHRVIRSALSALLRIAHRLDRQEPIEPEHVRDVVAFLRRYADGLHHEKEEQILFPALRGLELPNAGGPIADLLHEHAVGAALLDAMDAALDRGLPNGGAAPFAAAAHEYCRLVRRHTDKEERHVFPLARTTLPPVLQRTVADALRRHRVAHAREQERCLALLEPRIR
ncbi:MAG TPA: hemerythrin domain-containing protein [Sandaracinaceae bacterium]